MAEILKMVAEKSEKLEEKKNTQIGDKNKAKAEGGSTNPTEENQGKPVEFDETQAEALSKKVFDPILLTPVEN
ncbi:MAG: hypothetical protein LBU14_03430, partial [Candidatus Peribacteria bacterium]|nr:hypothetical protein [Candidatus Peribacteria bacterium]